MYSQIKNKKTKNIYDRKTQGRLYCSYSFDLLQSNNGDENNEIVQCTNCNAFYYAKYWNQSEKCFRASCGHTEAINVEVPAPAKRSPEEKKTPLLPETSILDLTSGDINVQTPGNVRSIRNRVKNLWINITYQIRLAIFTIIFILLSTLISAFAFRLWTLSGDTLGLNLESVLNSILRSAPPPLYVFYAGCVSSVLAAYTFYPKALPDYTGESSQLRRLIRFLALIQILLCFTCWLVNRFIGFSALVMLFNKEITIFELPQLSRFDYPWRTSSTATKLENIPKDWLGIYETAELFTAGAISIILIILSIKLFQLLTSRQTEDVDTEHGQIPARTRFYHKFVSALRYLVVTLSLILFSIAFSYNILQSNLVTIRLKINEAIITIASVTAETIDGLLSLQFYQELLTSFRAIDFLASINETMSKQPFLFLSIISLLVACLIYLPPGHKYFRSRTITLRTILTIFLGGLLGYLYSVTGDTSNFLLTTQVTLVVTFALLPIQRAFS